MNLLTPKTLALLMSMLCISLFYTSCDDDDDDTTTPDSEYTSVLNDVANNVIVDTYSKLANKAATLNSAISTLENNPTQSNLNAARQAWVDAREPWEKSEGFLFGPVDTDGIDPAIDSWPVNQTDLDNVLNSNDNLTTAYVEALDGTLKGFHTIEYLLWGADGNKDISEFTSRQFQYLTATTQVLTNDTQTLIDAWLPSQGNFLSNILNAGESTSIYISQKAVLEEFAAGIVGIADEVGNGKINDPLEQEDLSLEESQFSDNSKLDFANNIRSIKNVYEGVNGQGLTTVVSEENASLDTQIKSDIAAAIAAIEAIPGDFTDAIPANSPTRADAENAQAKVRALQTTLEENLLPLISGL